MIQLKRNTQQPTQTPVKRAGTGLETLDARRAGKPSTDAAKPVIGQIQPVTELDSARYYKAIYRAVYEYHERHYPPRLNDVSYWTEAANDMVSVAHRFNDEPFITTLLMAVYDELGREDTRLREGEGREDERREA